MKIRVVQIWGFLMTVLGWIFVACTMAMEGWKIASVGGMAGSSIIKVAWHWASLWRKCFTDSTAVSNCYDFPVLWSVEGTIQIVRGLLMAALSIGMLGFILSLLGMECTYLGGQDQSKHRKIYTGGVCHIISGALSTAGYAVYAQHVSITAAHPGPDNLRYDLGTPLFLGWVGSAFHMAGGFFHLWSVCTPLCGRKDKVITAQAKPDLEQNKSTTALSTASEITSKTKLSSISELSSGSDDSDDSDDTDDSDVSSIVTKSERTFRSGKSTATGRNARSVGSAISSGSSRYTRSSKSSRSLESSRSGSRSELQSRLSSRSSQSALPNPRSGTSGSRTVSSLSGSLSRGTRPFIKNSYI